MAAVILININCIIIVDIQRHECKITVIVFYFKFRLHSDLRCDLGEVFMCSRTLSTLVHI